MSAEDKKDGQIATAEEEAGELMPNEELNAEDDSRPKLEDKEVKSGEEDEEVVFAARCKSYRFDEGENEWKERGLGEIKLLKNKETGAARMLQRREHIFKVCICINVPDCSSLIKGQSVGDKGWVLCGMDYSEDVEATRETVCLRFKTPEDAQAFKKHFLELGGAAE